MDTQIKTKWIKALNSGEYKQGSGMLQQPGGYYCCLGVLCDLHNKETEGDNWKEVVDQVRYKDHIGMPPDEVFEWAGFDVSDEIILDSVSANIVNEGDNTPYKPGDSVTLQGLNDRGVPFRAIAIVIQRGL